MLRDRFIFMQIWLFFSVKSKMVQAHIGPFVFSPVFLCRQIKIIGQKLANSRVNVVSLQLERLRFSFPRFFIRRRTWGRDVWRFCSARCKVFARPLQDVRTFAAKCSHARCKPCCPGSLFLLAHLIVPDGSASLYRSLNGSLSSNAK